ncbi:MAG: hypothetical protein QOJ16_4616 [Acidobacteriota bacterium]|nr:hypothetical protein [Acidobacteriota bacterium]
MTWEFQEAVLRRLGASGAECEELLRYNENVFKIPDRIRPDKIRLPPPDEPFVACWEGWASSARERGAWAVLREHLPQLRFPIREGMSGTEAYRAATLRGVPPADLPEAAGLPLLRPELVELALHPSPAGRVPVLTVRGRADFVALVQALGHRNEPFPVPGSQGALMISGYNNWARVAALRREWEAREPDERQGSWGEELERLKPQRELYQDRFILLSDGPYSAVPAADLGLAEGEWRELSLAIRRDHESAHYFTRRLFGAMRNNLLDELIADYAGMVAAIGRFRADWFLRFLGLEAFPSLRPGGRLGIYRGKPPLSDGAFRVLQALIRDAALNLERFDATLPAGPRSLEERAEALTALASLRLEDLAAPGGEAALAEAFR